MKKLMAWPLSVGRPFWGFSFPLSLMAFSVMFSLDSDEKRLWGEIARAPSFWIVTVGVIIFFVVIIAGILPLEFLAAVEYNNVRR